jgi:hypothetical protein
MARTKSHKVEYFPMSASNGKRFDILYSMSDNGSELKHKAPLTWFILLQQLARADYHFLNVSDELDLMALSNVCKVNDQEFISIINLMVRMRIVHRQLWEKYKIIWIQELTDSLDIVYQKRASDLPCLETICIINGIDPTDIDISVRISSYQEDKSIQRKEGSKEVSKEGRKGESSDSPTTHPSLEIVTKYFLENDYSADLAKKAYDTYAPSWLDTHGNRIKNWKMKMQKVWFKPTEYQPKSHTPKGSTQVRPKRPSK